MKKLIFQVLLILPNILFGQEQWSQTFGGANDDFGCSIQQTSDGGFIICGSTTSFGNGGDDVYLIKTDENGQEQWSQTFGGAGNEIGWSVTQTSDGGFIICGSTTSFGNGGDDVYLIKTDENGQEIWSQTFGGANDDSGNSIQQTSGGFIICGSTTSFGNGGDDVYLIKTDENGQEIWSQTFGGAGNDFGWSVTQTNDGGFITSGYTDSYGNGGDMDVYLIKTDENGQEIWSQTFGGAGNDYSMSVIQSNDGGIITSGYTDSFGNGEFDVYLIKTDENGQEIWYQTFGGGGLDYSVSAIQTNSGGFIIAGLSNSFSDNYEYDVYLIRTDENGQEIWSDMFGGSGSDICLSVIQTNDGGFSLAGNSDSYGNGGYDVYLIKVGPGTYYNYEFVGCDSVLNIVTNDYIYETVATNDTLISFSGEDSIINQNLIVHESPEITEITGSSLVASPSVEYYQTQPLFENILDWGVDGGVIIQNFGNQIKVFWENEGFGQVELIETNSNGCSTTNTLIVEVSNETTSCNSISVDLESGWSMVGFCCSQDLNVSESMSEYVDNLIIIKDGNGQSYLPEYNFNGIGSFSRGSGYQIKTTQQINGFIMCNP